MVFNMFTFLDITINGSLIGRHLLESNYNSELLEERKLSLLEKGFNYYQVSLFLVSFRSAVLLGEATQ